MNEKLIRMVKIFAFSNFLALNVLWIGEYIKSINQNFMFCISNNHYGEFWIELVFFLVFGAIASAMLWRNIRE